MSYLICIVENSNGSLTTQSTGVTTNEESKINHLLRSKKLPPVFSLSGRSIVTDTILGFSDKPYPTAENSKSRSQNWEKLRENVRGSDWYKRSTAPQNDSGLRYYASKRQSSSDKTQFHQSSLPKRKSLQQEKLVG